MDSDSGDREKIMRECYEMIVQEEMNQEKND